MSDMPRIPSHLLPADGRFGSGPSRIHPDHLTRLAESGLMGTSHRQKPVRDLVGSLRAGLRELFRLPDDWEIALGNGGSTAFWAVAAASLVERRAAHAVFGEFGQKFAQETLAAPHLAPSLIVEAPAGQVVVLSGHEGEGDPLGQPDVFAHPHHETSTGALSPVRAIAPEGALLVVDATSIAGGIDVNVTDTDVYYFAPQKCFASDGGLWVALLSPAAQERARRLHDEAARGARWMPQILDLSVALANSQKNQTLNTPAIATLALMEQQTEWMLTSGGLPAMEARSRACADRLLAWAEACPVARPFISRPEWRSPVVVTIDFDDSVDAAWLDAALRANGVVDVNPYRGLKRNQLRVATFPSTEVADVEALLASIDYLLEHRS